MTYPARRMPLDLALVGKPTAPSVWEYTWKDTVLYALGVGAKQAELDYLYEGRGPRVLPSFAVVSKFQPMLDLLGRSGGNMAMIVHGGERVTVHGPLAPSGKLTTTATRRTRRRSSARATSRRRSPSRSRRRRSRRCSTGSRGT